ncbi:MAG: hypothetical protein IJL26_07515 [Clostridia bacterium]|nr:hypothetical protein [Clostridia bacterium]
MVEKGIQGFWKCRYKSKDKTFGLYSTYEHNVEINNGTMTYEHAATDFFDASSYNYFGPYTGSYTLTIGGFDAKLKDKYANTKTAGSVFFYNIIDGKVKVLYFDHVCEIANELPGQYGYDF